MSYIKVCVLENKTFGNCSNNGVSVTDYNNLYAEVEGGNISLEEVQECNGITLKLVERNINNKIIKHFEPQLESLAGKWTMSGGCFITTSDSRFSRTYGNQPIALHDRIE